MPKALSTGTYTNSFGNVVETTIDEFMKSGYSDNMTVRIREPLIMTSMRLLRPCVQENLMHTFINEEIIRARTRIHDGEITDPRSKTKLNIAKPVYEYVCTSSAKIYDMSECLYNLYPLYSEVMTKPSNLFEHFKKSFEQHKTFELLDVTIGNVDHIEGYHHNEKTSIIYPNGHPAMFDEKYMKQAKQAIHGLRWKRVNEPPIFGKQLDYDAYFNKKAEKDISIYDYVYSAETDEYYVIDYPELKMKVMKDNHPFFRIFSIAHDTDNGKIDKLFLQVPYNFFVKHIRSGELVIIKKYASLAAIHCHRNNQEINEILNKYRRQFIVNNNRFHGLSLEGEMEYESRYDRNSLNKEGIFAYAPFVYIRDYKRDNYYNTLLAIDKFCESYGTNTSDSFWKKMNSFIESRKLDKKKCFRLLRASIDVLIVSYMIDLDISYNTDYITPENLDNRFF